MMPNRAKRSSKPHRIPVPSEDKSEENETASHTYFEFVTKLSLVSDRDIENALIENATEMSLR